MKKITILLFIASIVFMILFVMGCTQTGSSSGGGGGGGNDGEGTPVDYKAMASIPEGTYNQTDGTSSFNNTLSGFSIGKYEVIYELWYSVYQWAILPANGYTFANYGTEGSSNSAAIASVPPTSRKMEPVTFINWRDAIVWCNAYSQMSSLTPVYYTDNAFTTPLKICDNDTTIRSNIEGNQDYPYVNWSANGYRLPTESEWQYVASNYGVTPYDYISGDNAPYNTSVTIGNYAWCFSNSGGKSHDAGTRIVNQLGIYDMSGNVSEWCWDWYGPYPNWDENNYKGMNLGGTLDCRTIRGGFWNIGASYITVGKRDLNFPYRTYNIIGFRVVRKN